MSKNTRKKYREFVAEIVRYADPGDNEAFTLEEFTDGVLEYLVATRRLDPSEFDGWPEDGLVAPLLSESKASEASA